MGTASPITASRSFRLWRGMIPQDLGEPKVASPDVRNLQLPSGKLT